jgi:protein pelota
MQIIKKNLKQGEIVVKVDNPEDLWYIHQLVSAGDIVSGRTERKIKLGGEDDRKQSVVKKTVFVELKVEKVEFHKYSDNLRIGGIITSAPEDIPLGSHHTLSIEPGISVGIRKESWPNYQLEKLQESTQKIRNKILIVIFDREEAIFAILKNQGHEILSKIKGDVAKKRFEAGGKKSFYSEIIDNIISYADRFEPDNIIVASPSFWKEYLVKEAPPELKKKLTLATCSEVDESAIQEVLQRPETFKVLESDRAAKELSLVEDLLKAVSKDEACYGMKECEEMIDIGAVKELLVSYEFLNKLRSGTESKHLKAERLMRLCEERGGKVHVISTEESDKKLAGLGGIAGTLRWKQTRK